MIKKITIKLPRILLHCIKLNYIVSIIQFGSSLQHRKDYKDIDLAVVIKKDCYEKFLKVAHGQSSEGFDISLIKQEEIGTPEKFRFGRHGAHFLYVLSIGKTLYGRNLFRRMTVTRNAIRQSIISSLYDYIYDVRRAVFQNKIPISIKRRKNKFIRLCLYLLEPTLKYPEVLNLDNNTIENYFKKHNLAFPTKNILITYERLWARVLKRLNLCN